MTTSTSLKLPEQLKARVIEAAAGNGQSPHAFMVEAIELQTQLAERRRELIGGALASELEVTQYGLVHDGDEVLSYLKTRLEGGKPARPRKRRL